jgi:hypothetical protein
MNRATASAITPAARPTATRRIRAPLRTVRAYSSHAKACTVSDPDVSGKTHTN